MMIENKNNDNKYGEIDLLHDYVEEKAFDIQEIREGISRTAYLCNMKTTKMCDEDETEQAALMLYFYEQSGFWFKSYVKFNPYFFLKCREPVINDMIGFLEKKFEKKFASINVQEKIDLDNVEHMSGKQDKYIKLSFNTISELVKVRSELKKHFEKNQKAEMNLFNEEVNVNLDFYAEIIDLREYDVYYHSRVCIDMEIRCSFWYKLTFKDNYIETIERIEDESMPRPEFTILAYDIETTKQPLKFPDARIDMVMLISYVVNGDGF